MRSAFFDGDDPRLAGGRSRTSARSRAPFQITALEYAGSHDGEVTFEIALESAGAVSFAVACMMAQPAARRGRGRARRRAPYRLCLTLGALAELEAAFAADDLGALVRALLAAGGCRRAT